MFGLGKLIYISLLLINSIAVLSEDRFLYKVGWSAQSDATEFAFDTTPNVKSKLINLTSAVRTLLRRTSSICKANVVPLIALNTLVIVYELLLG